MARRWPTDLVWTEIILEGENPWCGECGRAYETGGMRRRHLRGRENILKRLLVHVSGFNLSLGMCTR